MADLTSSAVPNRRSKIPNFLETGVRKLLIVVSVTGNVTIGRNLRISRGARINSWRGLTLGHDVSVGAGSVIEVDGEIGNWCLIARNVQILGRLDHAIDEVGTPMALSTWVGDRDELPADRVKIHDDVWIGAGSIVLGSTTVGEGAIIGAGSVVTKDVPPYAIWAGNPARHIRMRFESDALQSRHASILEELRASTL